MNTIRGSDAAFISCMIHGIFFKTVSTGELSFCFVFESIADAAGTGDHP